MLAKHLYDEIPTEDRPELIPTTGRIVASNGGELNLYGMAKLQINIQGIHVEHEFWVCDNEESGILGITFMEEANVVIDVGRRRVFIGNKSVMLFDDKGKPLHSKVISSKTVHIPPGREALISGRVCSRRNNNNTSATLEPAFCTFRKTGALIARVTVDTSKVNVPVRVFNPCDEHVTIYKNSTMGILTEIDQIKPFEPNTNSQMGCTNTVSNDEVPEHLADLYSRSVDGLSESEKLKLRFLLSEYSDVFARDSYDIGHTDVVTHHIETGNEPPVKQRPRRLPMVQLEELKKQVEDLKSRNIIRESHSNWASNVILVKKKDSTWRLCVDYRELNTKTKNQDPYILPRIDDTLDALAHAQYFCTLDLIQGYHQIELTESSKPKTAFITPRLTPSHWEYNYMPFGVQGGPSTFQRLMDKILKGLEYKIALAYLDDIIAFGKTIDECLDRLTIIFERLRKAGLKLKPKKCSLFKREILYLGHVVSHKGVSCDPEKVEAVARWTAPRTVRQVRTFLGTVGYYKRFIKGHADICKPLYNLTKKGVKFEWSTECEEAFQTLKQRLITAPIMGYPRDEGQYILDTDASGFAIGAVLSQVQIDPDGTKRERVISYASRVLRPPETRYCARRRELLAVVDFVKHFRAYLYGRSVIIRTDHASLGYIRSLKDINDQFARWIERLEECDYRIEVRRGVKHSNADGLSRYDCGGKKCICDGVRELEETTEAPQIHAVKFGQLWTPEEMHDAQMSDPDIAPIFQAKIDRAERPKWDDISPQGPVTKAYWGEWDRLEVRNNQLYRRWESDDGSTIRHQLILPHSYRKLVLEQLHDARTAGHLGKKRTLLKIQQRFYWYKMRDHISRWIRTCDRCQRRKRPGKTPRAPLKKYTVGYPMERICMDVLGPLIETPRGSKYILVICDYFSKWSQAFPIPDHTAKTVAEKFVTGWIALWGCPLSLHTDQGRDFESALFQETCALLNIDKTRTTPYHPSSDGLVERENSTIAQVLNAIVEEYEDWDIMLPFVMMSYRSSVHDSTSETPNMVMTGRQINLPLDVMTASDPELRYEHAPEYVNKLDEDLRKCYLRVRDAIGRAAIRQKHYHDRKSHLNVYKRGDLVLVKTMVRKPGVGKLMDRYEGPFTVLDKLSDVTYRIQQSPAKKPKVIHHDRLKPYYPRNPAENDTSWVENAPQQAPVPLPPPTPPPPPPLPVARPTRTLTPRVDVQPIVENHTDMADAGLDINNSVIADETELQPDQEMEIPNTDLMDTLEYGPADHDTLNTSADRDGPQHAREPLDSPEPDVSRDGMVDDHETPKSPPLSPPRKRHRQAPKRYGDWA